MSSLRNRTIILTIIFTAVNTILYFTAPVWFPSHGISKVQFPGYIHVLAWCCLPFAVAGLPGFYITGLLLSPLAHILPPAVRLVSFIVITSVINAMLYARAIPMALRFLKYLWVATLPKDMRGGPDHQE